MPATHSPLSCRPHPCPPAEAPTRSTVPQALTQADLLQMPFPVFACTVADLLQRLGYAQVAFMKAMHGRGKGRNAHGGYDIRALSASQRTRSLVIVQLKQYQRPLPRLNVDELRGTMLRVGASQGLLVTAGTLSAAAVEAVQAGQYAAPVRLIDGSELARLLSRSLTPHPPAHAAIGRGLGSPVFPPKNALAGSGDGSPLTIRVDIALFPAGQDTPRW